MAQSARAFIEDCAACLCNACVCNNHRDYETFFKSEGNTFLVEIALSEVKQLYNTLDPSPFRDRDLDENAASYIKDTVGLFPLSVPVRLVIYCPAYAPGEGTLAEAFTTPPPDKQEMSHASVSADELSGLRWNLTNATHEEAVRNYYKFQLLQQKRKLAISRDVAHKTLWIGVVIIFLSIVIMANLPDLHDYPWTRDSIIIVLQTTCAVAIWGPFSWFLYDWWPQRRTHRLLRKLSTMEVIMTNVPRQASEGLSVPTEMV
eukprot:gb/GEZN01016007.1/.p1 GENE.gb/GEZN01016007.1/~~gb/GEZN01016007.1/.p1  ORF type:complete len:260 (+),score=18.03 gb/GEZN01016007.1/:87-866(+)